MEKYGVVDPGTTPTTTQTLKTAKVKPRCRCCSLKASAAKMAQLDALDDDVAKRMATAVAEKCPKGAYSI
ncbi:MAG: hypothetical protein WDA42_05560 [Candidatus Bathyarchaeia archaeon]